MALLSRVTVFEGEIIDGDNFQNYGGKLPGE